jgi:hypothetical protein
MIRSILASSLALMCVIGCVVQAAAAETSGGYAIVVRKETASEWKKVVDTLQGKHQGRVFVYEATPDEVRREVGAIRPRYVCFVCPPTENFPEFVLLANKFCRTLDDDPYVDAIWGILTGYDAAHAVQLVNAEPVVVKRVFTKTLGDWLNWVPEGDYVTEWTRDRGELGEKKSGGDFIIKGGGPKSDADDVKYVHNLMSRDSFDMIIGSGHGGHHNWMLMYPSGSGYLTAKGGKLTMSAPGVELPLAVSRPKIYWAVGNCLTGVVNSRGNSFKDSYALAWMNNGTRQYIGAVQPTWYELNWNMADWFLKQEGRWTFSESLFLLRQWSQYSLAENLVKGQDQKGTEYTDGIFVLYGDPALEGRVEKSREPALTETLDIQKTDGSDVVRMTYRVKVNFVGEGNKRTAEKYDGWRFFTYLLPYQLDEVNVEKTDFAKVVIPGETLIWDAGTGLKVGDERSVVFTARRVGQ